jgi:hypothetical protein
MSPAPRTLPSELAIKAHARKSRTQSRLIYAIASANLMALGVEIVPPIPQHFAHFLAWIDA